MSDFMMHHQTFKAVTADLISNYDAAMDTHGGADYPAIAAQVVGQALPQDRLSADVMVLALDVFDNLGHDKVVRSAAGEWEQTVVEDDAHGPPKEHLRPLSDLMITRALDAFATTRCPHSIFDRSKGDGVFATLFPFVMPQKHHLDADRNAAFLPTEALMLFDLLHFGLGPRHRLVASGVDFLPQAQLPLFTFQREWMAAYNPPLVSSAKKDLNSYLLPLDQFRNTDIYFASDFDNLTAAYSSTNASSPRAVKAYRGPEFLSEYAELAQTTVRGGYNPLVDDFCNYQFLVRERV